MTRVKGWVAAHLLNRDKDNARARSFDSGEPIYVEQIPSDAVRCEGYMCKGCGHVYLHDNVSECDCTVGEYKFKKVSVIIIPEEEI